MPEHMDAWWQRRQRSKEAEVPYEIGTYREQWLTYPALIRQYHPDLNRGIALSQIPPAADVYVLWQCDTGHTFVATPAEQRARPGRRRRKSSWCPECTMLATGVGRPKALPIRESSGDPMPPVAVSAPARPRVSRSAAPGLCLTSRARDHAVGHPFRSDCAPAPASSMEGDLRSRLFERFDLEPGLNAVRLASPFFNHLEAWPDLVIGELKVAIELDTVGRDGLEHVGEREVVDRRKDRALRSVGWEVIRVRIAPLLAIGEHDILAPGVSARLVDRLIDEMAIIRGELIVRSYLRVPSGGTLLPRS